MASRGCTFKWSQFPLLREKILWTCFMQVDNKFATQVREKRNLMTYIPLWISIVYHQKRARKISQILFAAIWSVTLSAFEPRDKSVPCLFNLATHVILQRRINQSDTRYTSETCKPVELKIKFIKSYFISIWSCSRLFTSFDAYFVWYLCSDTDYPIAAAESVS